jgi:quercetin dioxygenase-like cupin family protein
MSTQGGTAMRYQGILPAGLFAAAAIGLAAAPVPVRAETDSKGFVRTLPSQMEWQVGEGTPLAVLEGDPSKPGIYVARIKFPPHLFSRPHWHSTDRHIVVLKGTWYMGVGETFDPSTAVPMPAGSYVKHPAGVPHWDGAKGEEVELQVIGMGPVTTDLVKKDAPMFGPDKQD